jgi:hypothetical protein
MTRTYTKDISRSEENIEKQTNEVASTSEPVQPIEAIVEVQQERKKKRSQTQPTQSTIDKGSRPHIVRNELEDDTVAPAPVLRGTNRKKMN